MRKVSTLPGLVALVGLVLAFYAGGNSAAAWTCPSGMARISAGGAIAGASQGGTATVNFTVAENCTLQLSLVSYKAPSASFSASTASQQVIFDSKTMTLGAGAHTLSVSVPNCFFQVDFVFGAPIATLGPAGSSNFYSAQGRLISGMNGGTASCATTTPPTTGNGGGTGTTGTVIPTTTTTTTTTNVIPAGPITWAPGFGPNGVVASVQPAPTTTTVAGTQAAPVAVLPSTSTGSGDNSGVILLGLASIAMGVVLLRPGRRVKAESRFE